MSSQRVDVEIMWLLEDAEEALKKHMCPNDGSTDTVCYPNNKKCPARKIARDIARRLVAERRREE